MMQDGTSERSQNGKTTIQQKSMMNGIEMVEVSGHTNRNRQHSCVIQILQFAIINILITTTFTTSTVMSEELSPRIQTKQADNNISKAPSMILNHPHQQIAPANLPHLPSIINHILHPQSIFSSCYSQPKLEDYLKIKSWDKPKDTLRGIQQKKQAFVNYVKPTQLQCDPLKTSNKIQNDQNTFSRIKQQFSEFTFYKNSKTHTLVFVRIIPSRFSKCNIAVSNIRGEIFKYYPNVFLSKKEGKIIKFITENKEAFIVIYDYTKVEVTVKAFPSLLNQAHLIYYVIFDLQPSKEVFSPIIEKIKEHATGILKNNNKNVILISNGVRELNINTYLEEITQKLKHLQTQQQNFLNEFRGFKSKIQRNLTFDMMSINLWRQFKWNGLYLVDKIIQLFIKKQRQMDSMIIKDPQVHHTPMRLETCQNCALCLTKTLQIKRPRRTFWICTSCSAENQKPIYLCKGCFKSYHTKGDVYVYKKNEKKSKKYQRILRQRKIQNRRDKFEVKQQEVKVQSKMVTQNDKRLMDLDIKCEEFFIKIEQLIEEKCFSSAQFYLQMLMNMSILKTQQYLSKNNWKEEGFIKIQEDQ